MAGLRIRKLRYQQSLEARCPRLKRWKGHSERRFEFLVCAASSILPSLDYTCANLSYTRRRKPPLDVGYLARKVMQKCGSRKENRESCLLMLPVCDRSINSHPGSETRCEATWLLVRRLRAANPLHRSDRYDSSS